MAFKAAGLKGDVCVWRDVLSDGPAVLEVGSEEFWEVRNAYMTSAFDIPTGEFLEKAQAEFDRITQFTNYEEAVLWFEYDLFCQVNLIALMHWFGQQDRGETKVSLICVGKEEGHEKLVGLGELPPDAYPGLFDRRRIMGSYDFTFCSDAYQAWCSSDPTDLDNFILISSNEFPYLSDALRAHQRRFPSAQSGLTEIESKIISLIQSGINQERRIVGSILRWQEFYGFGDLQYFQVLKRLAPLFKSSENLSLKPEVTQALEEQKPVNLIDRNYFLGGARASKWLWNENTEELTSQEISSS